MDKQQGRPKIRSGAYWTGYKKGYSKGVAYGRRKESQRNKPLIDWAMNKIGKDALILRLYKLLGRNNMPGNLVVINGSKGLTWYVGDSKIDSVIEFLHSVGQQEQPIAPNSAIQTDAQEEQLE